MIPLKDENPSRSFPFVNLFLILANISVFIYQNFFVPGGAKALFFQLGCIPYEFSHFVDLNPSALVPVPLTILTAMFLHGGWIHILSNMLFLWIFGDNIEDTLGHFKYLAFYILCGLIASFFHIFTNLNSQIPTIGASGAIAGSDGCIHGSLSKSAHQNIIDIRDIYTGSKNPCNNNARLLDIDTGFKRIC